MHAPADPGHGPFEGAMLDDPYESFALAHETAPVLYSGLVDHWPVTGRDDILSIFMAPDAYSAGNTIQPDTEMFDSSVVARQRRALRDVMIVGAGVPAGHNSCCCLAPPTTIPARSAPRSRSTSAGRAPRIASASAAGSISAWGAPLARLEARAVLKVLTRRLPDARLVDPQRFGFVPNIAFRAPLHLLVEW